MPEIAIAIVAIAWVLLDTLWKMHNSREVISWENEWDAPADKTRRTRTRCTGLGPTDGMHDGG